MSERGDQHLSDFDFRAKQDKLAAQFAFQDTIDDGPPCTYFKHPLYQAADRRILDAREEHYRWGILMHLLIDFRNVMRRYSNAPAGSEHARGALAHEATMQIDFADAMHKETELEEKRLYALREELKQQIENGEHHVQH